MEKILALSWKQPFATAMLYGKIETRVWSTEYRGLVLICTSKAAYDQRTVTNICGQKQFIEMCKKMNADSGTLDLNGFAIALGRLVDCRLMTQDDEDKTFVKYREPWTEVVVSKATGNVKTVTKKLWCHVYEDVQPIEPFAWHGSQGWKEVDEETKRLIKIKQLV